MIDFDILNKKEHLSMNENVFLAGSKIPTKKALCYVRWAHPVNIIVDEINKAITILCNQFSSQEVSSTPGPDSMGNQGDGLGGVLDSARRGFEDEGGEGRLGGEKRKENNP